MKEGKKIYKADGKKFGTCPKCGHRNGLNPFRFGGLSRATYELTGHRIIHHKCKKCLWQGYVLVNAEDRNVNKFVHAAFFIFWALIILGIPIYLFNGFIN